MAVRPKPKVVRANEDAFIQGAPDANAPTAADDYDKGYKIGRRRQISLALKPDLLRRVDAEAERTGLPRATIITMAIIHALDDGIYGGR